LSAVQLGAITPEYRYRRRLNEIAVRILNMRGTSFKMKHKYGKYFHIIIEI